MLRIGTDCSGIEAPIQALKQLKIPHVHIFSSDIDKYCIQSIKVNYNPTIIFGDIDGLFPDGDITKRNNSLLPNIDLYISGFPCQPFSIAGERKGFKDDRGNVFFACLDVIKKKKPKYFILENVKGLLSHDKKRTFEIIIKELKKLKKYQIHWKVLNTQDYGIPQNRERVFIVGLRSQKKFEWPKKKKMKELRKYIDWNDNKQYNSIRINNFKNQINKKNFFICTDFLGYNNFMKIQKVCPCIRAQTTLWNVRQKRFANIQEYLSLQGFPKNFKQCVSNTQMKKQIGNSMSVNVLVELLKQIL